MTAPKVNIRRAVVDDLRNLRSLWDRDHLPAAFDARLTEFQVIEGPRGELLGAAGLQIAGTHGQVHTEQFLHPEQADELRPQLWERLLAVANNHGLTRLWTLEKNPFWETARFGPATSEEMKSFPAPFGSAEPPWRTLRLRDETVPRLSLEQELALFRDSQRQSGEKMIRQAKVIKAVALVVVALLFLFVAVGAVLMMKRYHTFSPGLPGTSRR